ncbi:MAG: KEOPS complex subunit Pcc1 [Candidatus Micrarchaeota archaeon]|nr:KEOPS complex subunit Pcc1 [Candidatus Micrarchaeota archaeon]
MKSKNYSCTARLTFLFGTQRLLKAAYDSLSAEASYSHRGKSKISAKDGKLVITIFAEDPTSLKASLNSYLRLMQMIKTLQQEV